MARAPDARVEQAKELYQQGKKLVEISAQLGVPEGTVRRWKHTYGWDGERSGKKSERSKKKNERSERVKEAVAEEVGQVIENPDLNDKQRLFCLYYVRCFNTTKAYQKAYGCDYATAASVGYRLLAKDGVRAEIQRLKQARLNRELLDESDIFQKYMDIAFADITDYVEFGREKVQVMGAFGPVMITDEETGQKVPVTKVINTVRFRESCDVDGSIIAEVKQGKDGASVKLADRMKALEWLAAHMDLATDEQRSRMEHLKAQTDKITGQGQEIEDLDEIEGEIYGK